MCSLHSNGAKPSCQMLIAWDHRQGEHCAGPATCIDVAGWKDTWGDTCQTYAEKLYCTTAGASLIISLETTACTEK